MEDTTVEVQTSSSTARTRRFRKQNTRVDYYPCTEAWQAIEATCREYPGESLRGMIDLLVVEGFAARQNQR